MNQFIISRMFGAVMPKGFNLLLYPHSPTDINTQVTFLGTLERRTTIGFNTNTPLFLCSPFLLITDDKKLSLINEQKDLNSACVCI